MAKKKNRTHLDHQTHLTVGEVSALLKHCSSRDYALFFLMYELALRRSEPGLITRSHWTGSEMYVTRKKGSLSKTRPLSLKLQKALKAWDAKRRATSSWLFPGSRAGGMTGEGVRSAFRTACLRAGLSNRADYPHILKHSRCTHLVEAGASREYIKEVAGHAMATSTDRYFHLTEKMRKQGDLLSTAILDDL